MCTGRSNDDAVQVFTGEQVPPALVLSQTHHEGESLVTGINMFAGAA